SRTRRAIYVNLLLNPERFTGGAGPSAARIWRSVYDVSFFLPPRTKIIYALRTCHIGSYYLARSGPS
ncbi:hypothetical protein HK405_010183, partial [Cladochytrium tenue]